MAAMVSSSTPAPRSTPWISAPSAPAMGSTSSAAVVRITSLPIASVSQPPGRLDPVLDESFDPRPRRAAATRRGHQHHHLAHPEVPVAGEVVPRDPQRVRRDDDLDVGEAPPALLEELPEPRDALLRPLRVEREAVPAVPVLRDAPECRL